MAKGIMYVDNIRVEFDDEPTIMDVCRKAGVEMPNFCFHSDLSVYGACRMCMVEDLTPARSTPPARPSRKTACASAPTHRAFSNTAA